MAHTPFSKPAPHTQLAQQGQPNVGTASPRIGLVIGAKGQPRAPWKSPTARETMGHSLAATALHHDGKHMPLFQDRGKLAPPPDFLGSIFAHTSKKSDIQISIRRQNHRTNSQIPARPLSCGTQRSNTSQGARSTCSDLVTDSLRTSKEGRPPENKSYIKYERHPHMKARRPKIRIPVLVVLYDIN